jgi:hypothetical protein
LVPLAVFNFLGEIKMPQTVALQRGTTTTTSNNAWVNLFTQSGGIATRVIINGLYITAGAGPGTYQTMLLSINSNSGGVYLPVAFKSSSTSYAPSTMFFLPGNTASPSAGAQTSSTSATASNQSILTASTSNGSPLPGDMYVIGPTQANNMSSQTSQFEFCPQNFWIGPNDSVSFACRSPNINTYTVVFSFTTITES